MRKVPRDELGVEVWVHEQEVDLRGFDDLSDLVEVVKYTALTNCNGEGTHSLHPKIVPNPMKHRQNASNPPLSVTSHYGVNLRYVGVEGNGLGAVPLIHDC